MRPVFFIWGFIFGDRATIINRRWARTYRPIGKSDSPKWSFVDGIFWVELFMAKFGQIRP